MMVSQGGTGASTSAPSVRKIYEAIYGVTGSTVDPKKSVLVGGAPAAKLPTVRSDGTPVYPGMPKTVAAAKPRHPGRRDRPTGAAAPKPSSTSTGMVRRAPAAARRRPRRAVARRRSKRPRAPDVRLWS